MATLEDLAISIVREHRRDRAAIRFQRGRPWIVRQVVFCACCGDRWPCLRVAWAHDLLSSSREVFRRAVDDGTALH